MKELTYERPGVIALCCENDTELSEVSGGLLFGYISLSQATLTAFVVAYVSFARSYGNNSQGYTNFRNDCVRHAAGFTQVTFTAFLTMLEDAPEIPDFLRRQLAIVQQNIATNRADYCNTV